MLTTIRIARKTTAMALFTALVLCMITGCENPPDNEPCADVPPDASFSIYGREVVLTQNDSGSYTMTMTQADNQTRWKSDTDNRTGSTDIACLTQLWPERFGQDEVASLLLYRNPEDNDTAWFCCMVSSFAAGDNNTVVTFNIVPLTGTGSVPDSLESTVLMLDSLCPNTGCSSGRIVNGYCIEPFANLYGAYLASANLTSANLSHANLENAVLFAARLEKANLSWANLKGANLRTAVLSEVDLLGADLEEADLEYADLERAQLTHANLTETDLQYANLTETDLQYAILYKADLLYAVLDNATLIEAKLLGANLSWTDLSGADLEEAYLIKALLKKANLKKANLKKADLEGAILREADLTDATLEGANLDNATLTGVTVSNTTAPDGTVVNSEAELQEHLNIN